MNVRAAIAWLVLGACYHSTELSTGVTACDVSCDASTTCPDNFTCGSTGACEEVINEALEGSGINTAFWAPIVGISPLGTLTNAIETSEGLSVTINDDGPNLRVIGGVQTESPQNLTDNTVTVYLGEFTASTRPTEGRVGAFLALEDVAGNAYRIGIAEDSNGETQAVFEVQNSVCSDEMTDGCQKGFPDNTELGYARIRDNNSVHRVYFETSPDATIWTTQLQFTDTAVNVTSLTIELQVGAGPSGTGTVSSFDGSANATFRDFTLDTSHCPWPPP